ncbi:hypothetical protein [Siphonobacter aquaeclarae]|uniref:Core-2/I-Branching enzyme n=1 Tax=Siphonobacter aquaeclarae TaxID=563176 RepID=A0A1G9NCZ5_9BACT|nr:hypothetical protein [Siphonobacter aquaeclarae]SDL84358.1 hypothetical protein SAMN04488090_1958 [Siphonobacter aquaeclarae]
MSGVTLILLFNHNYEKNIEPLEKLYGDRFSSIYFIMPFYSGKKKNVISVFDDSFYFQGYMAYALDRLKDNGSEHFIIAGDDLILHPAINEHNYMEFFKVDSSTAFVPFIFELTDTTVGQPWRKIRPAWGHISKAVDLRLESPGINIWNYLPKAEDARILLARHGYQFEPILPRSVFIGELSAKRNDKSFLFTKLSQIKLAMRYFRYLAGSRRVPYPLLGGYVDLLVLPRANLESFVQYCGAFSARNLFVEMAVPTAACLAFDNVVTETDMEWKGLTYWSAKDVELFESSYSNSLSELWRRFPDNTLYIHPIKLSRWK